MRWINLFSVIPNRFLFGFLEIIFYVLLYFPIFFFSL